MQRIKRHNSLYFIFVLLLVILSACAGVVTQGAATPQAGPPSSEALVSAAWLKEHLSDPGIVVLDVSSTEEVYRQGHIPGALFVDWTKDLTDPGNAVKGQILTKAQAERLFSRLGINPDDTIILYGDRDNLFAARAFWVFTYYGHRQVRLLNGGRTAWVQSGSPLSTTIPDVRPSRYTIRQTRTNLRADVETVQALFDGRGIVLDVRSPKEYAGVDVRARRGGHIPGAININWVATVNADGTFKPVSRLLSLYRAAGVRPDRPVITYCQTGVRAAHTWFVLTYLLNYPHVKVYDGSWEEWGNAPGLAIER